MTGAPDRAPATAPGAAGAGRRRRVAIVAYFFPPLGGVAVARTTGFVRHLPAAGWEPVVIAPSASSYALRDADGAGALGLDVEIHRAPSPEPGHLAGLARWAWGHVRGRGVKAAAATAATTGAAAGSASPSPSPPPLRRTGALATLPARLRRLAWFPDDQAGWFPFALVVLLAAGRGRRLDAVVSSASPVTAHVVALVGSRLLGIPWIADFRDPWLDNPIEPPAGRFARWRRATLEAVIVRCAARTTFATPTLRDVYASRYPRRAHRMITIPNGYELPATPGTATRNEPRHEAGTASDGDTGRFDLVYTGSLYRPAELATFLDGLERFAGLDPVGARRLRVTFVGTVTSDCRAVIDDHQRAAGHAPEVRLTGFVSRTTAADAVAGADAALALLGSGPGMEMFVGAKLYEYLVQDRQVFAVVPPGDTRAVLQDLGWGVIADPDAASIAEGLQRLLATEPPVRAADPDRRYSRERLTGRLARALDEVTGS